MARKKAPKVDKFHSKAPEDVVENLDDIIDKHHEDLGDSHIQVWMKHGGWKSKSKTVFGKVQVMSDVFRRGMDCDAILYLNADMWKLFGQPQKNYLLDHFMYQLQAVTDRHDDIKTAMDGRPLLTTAPHDFEGYVDIVKRHGVIMEDVKRLASAMKETNQITIDEVIEEPKTEVREGIEYKLDGSGAVIVDKDQAELILQDGEVKPLEPMQGVGDKPGKVTSISARAQKKLDDAAKLAATNLDPMAALLNDTKEMQDDDLPM